GTIGFTLTLRDVTQERQVSQMKTDFVSFVTHQLRTPLAGIKWMLELASQTPRVPTDAKSYVGDARAAAERLIGLVNDLLDVSRRVGVENGPTARWAITDSGIGIPKASLANLFEKFYRADNAHTVETEGTGLGLYLVRLIIEKFGGQVWCESEEGRGSTFIFT